MSLINDALKRARQEAARRDATQKGLPYPWLSSDLPANRPSQRPRRVLWAVGLIGLLALAVGGTYQWTASRLSGGGDPVAGEVASTETAPPVAVAETGIEEAPSRLAPDLDSGAAAAAEPPAARPPSSRQPEIPPTEEAAAVPSTAEPDAPRPATGPVATPAGADEPQPTAPTATAPAPDEEPAQDESAGEEPEAEGESFVRNFSHPDGTTLDLSGIVWSAEPLAVLNGEILTVGDSIHGYRIEEIERDFVKLRRADEVVTIRLR